VFTYGKHRVGNYAFVNSFLALAKKDRVEPAMWRVVHYHDPVPHVPLPNGSFPSILLRYDYAHETEEVYYSNRESSIYQQCPTAPGEVVNGFENPSCSYAAPLVECLNSDHLFYLNKTFKHTDLGSKCIRDVQNVVVV